MRTLTISGSPLAVSGSSLLLPEWHELASWTHAWDAVDAETYLPGATEQSDYSVSGAVARVDEIPDRIGDFPALRDQGPHAVLSGRASPFPGPRYLASSPRFNGRPAFVTGHPTTETFGGAGSPEYSVLSPTVGPRTEATYFGVAGAGYAAPWTFAFLARPTTAQGNTPAAGLWDSTTGELASTTVHAGKQLASGLEWQSSNWTSGIPTNRITSTHLSSIDETVLIIIFTSTTAGQSFQEINWRDSAGNMNTERTLGTLDANAFRECFWGWVHPFYMSTGAIKAGTLTEAEINRVRSWAGRFMPAASSLATE